jgi:hypothetical protein
MDGKPVVEIRASGASRRESNKSATKLNVVRRIDEPARRPRPGAPRSSLCGRRVSPNR